MLKRELLREKVKRLTLKRQRQFEKLSVNALRLSEVTLPNFVRFFFSLVVPHFVHFCSSLVLLFCLGPAFSDCSRIFFHRPHFQAAPSLITSSLICWNQPSYRNQPCTNVSRLIKKNQLFVEDMKCGDLDLVRRHLYLDMDPELLPPDPDPCPTCFISIGSIKSILNHP